MIGVYHDTVGQNGVLELDFAIDRQGRVNATHAARYKQLGDWVRGCYGTPLANTTASSNSATIQFAQTSGTVPHHSHHVLHDALVFGLRVAP